MMYQAPGRQRAVGTVSFLPALNSTAQQASNAPLWGRGNQRSGSAHPASLLPTIQPGACPTVGPAVHVDLGPVVQSQQGEEGEDSGEDVLETLGVRLAEQSPEHHREEDWWFRSEPGSQGLHYPVPLPGFLPPSFTPAPQLRIQRQVNMRTRMAVMDGMDRTRVPVTSWRLVRKLWAEVDRAAESVEVGIRAREPELTLNTGVPDLLVTWESPSPALESEEKGPAGGLPEAGWSLQPRPPSLQQVTAHTPGVQASVPSSREGSCGSADLSLFSTRMALRARRLLKTLKILKKFGL